MKITIVGSASPSAEEALWEDAGWDIWGLAWRSMPRASILFETHHPSTWPHHAPADYIAQLSRSGLPLYLLHAVPALPNALEYPMADVKADLCPPGQEADFFTSTLAYMVALAITKKPDEIGLWGCDMRADSEYAYQRPAMEYLIGLARGSGIKVFIPRSSALCKANFQYGATVSDSPIPPATGITEEILNERLTRYVRDKADAQERMTIERTRMNVLDGSIQEVEHLIAFVRHFNRGGVIT